MAFIVMYQRRLVRMEVGGALRRAKKMMRKRREFAASESERDDAATPFISITSGSDCLPHFLPQMCHLICILMQFASPCHRQKKKKKNLQRGLISHVVRRH